jgi:hypothetical protein
VVDVLCARPSASTSATLICTDAWSFEVISRSESAVILNINFVAAIQQHTGGGTFAGNVEINKNTLIDDISMVAGLSTTTSPGRFPCRIGGDELYSCLAVLTSYSRLNYVEK